MGQAAVILSAQAAAHKPVEYGPDVLKRHWRAKCAWRFGHSGHREAQMLPELARFICDDWFPEEKRGAKLKASGVESESSEAGELITAIG